MWCRERRLDAEFGQRLIGALGVEGLRAPAVFDGPIDSPSFLAYVEQVLVGSSGRSDEAPSERSRNQEENSGVSRAIHIPPRSFGASSNAAPRWRGCATTGLVRISQQSGRRDLIGGASGRVSNQRTA